MRPFLTLFFKTKNLLVICFNKYLNFIAFYYNRVVISEDYHINGVIYIKNKGSIKIGKSFKVNSGTKRNPIGGDTITRFIIEKNGELLIGNNVGISNSTIYVASKVSIFDNVRIGGSCRIWDTNFHSIDFNERIFGKDDKVISKPIIIEENVFIGGGAMILKGVTIGRNSIIAAGSVVTKNIPPNEIWGGNPARFIKKI